MSVVARRAPASDDEPTMEQIVAEMQALREIMDRDQAEIDRLKAETRALRLSTRAILDELMAKTKTC